MEVLWRGVGVVGLLQCAMGVDGVSLQAFGTVLSPQNRPSPDRTPSPNKHRPSSDPSPDVQFANKENCRLPMSPPQGLPRTVGDPPTPLAELGQATPPCNRFGKSPPSGPRGLTPRVSRTQAYSCSRTVEAPYSPDSQEPCGGIAFTVPASRVVENGLTGVSYTVGGMLGAGFSGQVYEFTKTEK